MPERGGGPFGAIEICRHVISLSVFGGRHTGASTASGTTAGRCPASAARLYDSPKIEALGWHARIRGQ
jgi:hypothetical protein